MTYTIPYVATPIDPKTHERDAIGFDTETHLIAMGALAPRLVCITAAWREGDQMVTDIAARADSDDSLRKLANIICNPGEPRKRIGHNLAFDTAVLAAEYPEALPFIFQCYEKGLFRCTKVREKLLRLAITGDLSFIKDAQGENRAADYSLSGLVKHYFNVDISENKTASDAWRLNFATLEPYPSHEWPTDASNYAKEDAVWALEIASAQEVLRQQVIEQRGIDPFVVQDERIFFDFCLHLIACQGVRIDPEEKARIAHWLSEELDPSKFTDLYKAGILIPAEAPRPHKNNPSKTTKGQPEKQSTTTLRAHIVYLWKKYGGAEAGDDNPVKLKVTSPSKMFPKGQISVSSEVLDDLSHLDPMLGLLSHRNGLQKILTTELPRMCVRDKEGNPVRDAEIVHPQFDSLISTGRTSCRGSDSLPSFNCQNVNPAVRRCYIPREGYLLCSVDFSYMELVTWAQACKKILGFSRLLDIINAGWDPHAWLGSRLASTIDHDYMEFARISGLLGNEQALYESFLAMKKGSPEQRAFFKHWRTFAKPTGLGYPGGLSSRTFVAYAKKMYGIVTDLETSTKLRDAWRSALPEADPYFAWVKEQGDPYNTVTKKWFDDDGNEVVDEKPALGYFSPLGMFRAGCDYCEVANGEGLQTWSADGMMSATCLVVRACMDASFGSMLSGRVRPLMQIHDEIVSEVLDDGHAHEYAFEKARLMVEGFSIVLPDVKIKAAPVLMRRWDKDAEQVFDAEGRLVPWEPEVKS